MKPRGDDSDGSTSASEGESGSDDEGAGAGGAGGSFAGPRAGAGMGSKAKAAALELLEGAWERRRSSFQAVLFRHMQRQRPWVQAGLGSGSSFAGGLHQHAVHPPPGLHTTHPQPCRRPCPPPPMLPCRHR